MRKVPKLSKAKGKRWPKGQSSNSNPDTKKFRQAAKSRFFRHETGTSSALTIGALKTLDAFNSTKSLKKPEPIDIDEESNATSWASGKTFKTFASDWSECSNASFSKLLNNFQSNSFMHKEMLAVLAAVTEVIKANGGKETSTEYFGALMTALSVSESEDSTAAILTLLGMGIKTVPHEVLRLKFSEASKTFLEILMKYSEMENPAILRATIGCLSVLLRAQDSGTWANASTTEIFHSVLVFSTYAKPKIRKAAQHAVCAILKASFMFSEEDTHPAAAVASKYCNQQIEKGIMGGGTTTLHILTLLKEIISAFPKSHIKTTCETILKLMTLGNPLITTCSFEVLHGLFISAPPTTRLLPTLNAQIIHALYDYQPSNTDTQATLAWLTVMQEAHRTLAKNDPNLCAENLTKFFIVASKLWLSDKDQIVKGSFVTLRTVAMDCIKLCSETRNYPKLCENIFAIAENGLKYQYHNSWVHVFSLLGVLFEVIGPSGESYMGSCLKSLANLRDTNNFGYIAELEITIGKAIRALGPEIIVKVIPLNITGKEVNYEFKTTWLLPVLKTNIQSSTLKFFIDYFLPMALICERKSKEFHAANDRIGAHSYDLLQNQIWALLPSFSNNANDVKTSFKAIAKTLGVIISDRKQLRVPVMAALRKLITHCQSSHNKEDREELSKFAKNYLPILFNLYTTKPHGTDEEGERLASFETIKVYLTITKPELSGELFDKALTRLEEKKEDAFNKESVMDLIKVLIPYQDESRLEKIYSKCLKTLKESKDKKKEKKDEKKSYRLLEELCASDSENCKKFVAVKRQEILSFLLKSLKKAKITNRGARLRCLFRMVKLLPKDQIDAVKTIIPETIICCKDINQNTRAYAFKMLEEVFNICREWSTKSDEDTMRDYIGLIFGGLAGSQTLVSATVLALAKLTHSFRLELPEDLMQLILENVCLLSAVPTREIVGPCLGYFKVFITSFQKQRVLPYVPTIVKAIVGMTDDCKRHFRLKVRDVLDRLLRKYGYETIQPLVPKDDNIMQKRLKNLKRINAKKKSAKDETEVDDDDGLEEFALKAKPKSIEEILASSDESDEEEEPKKKSKKQKKLEMFIQEDSENIVDFISPSATGKVSASKPSAKTSKKKESDIKMSSDGRLIITDDGDDDEMGGSDEDSDLDDVASAMSEVVIGKKRKLSVSSDAPNKYQAGGSGIHRPLDKTEVPVRIQKKEKDKRKKNKDVSGFKSGKEYRAKKAKGDMKLKGKPDPFAYIPLSRKLLNRRKKLKNSGKFKNIIKSAIKGANKGSKAKMRARK